MVEYPVDFSSRVEEEEGGKRWRLETEEGLETEMSPPEEFGGSDENPSPEDLFSASIVSCLVATFRSIARNKNLSYDGIEAGAEVSLDRGEDTRPIMKEASIELTVEGVQDEEKASEVAEMAEKNCFIHRSIKTETEVSFEFL